MKKIIFGLICFVLCASVVLVSCSDKTASAQDETTNDEMVAEDILEEIPVIEEEEAPIFEYDFSGKGAVLIAYNGDLEEVVLEEKPIRMKKEKKEVIVTEEVTNKDGTVTTIEKVVEETVTTPVEYELVEIDKGVFMGNETVKKIVIPDTVKAIGEACFQNCTSLEEVVLPANLKDIKTLTFHGCSALNTLNIPEKVESVGIFAFGDYFSKTPWYDSLSGESVIVGDGVLLKYNGYASSVSYGEEVKKVAYYAFLDTPVKTVKFAGSVEEIDVLATYHTDATILLPKGSSLVNQLKLSNVKVDTYEVE